MPAAGRTTRVPIALYRAVGAGKRGSKSGRADLAVTASGQDLAARLRTFNRQHGRRIESRDALVETIRAVGATLEPAKIADLLIDRASAWVPAPCWGVVCGDLSGRLTVLAERGVGREARPALCDVAQWVMDHDEEFVSANLAADSRLGPSFPAAAVAFPLNSRTRRIGALVGFDRTPCAAALEVPARLLRGMRVLVEPAASALDSAIRLQRAEELSVTDELTDLYNSRYLRQALHRETKRASRNGRPLSLLFVDLDGFKGVNDQYGHLFGSRALVEAAAVIRGSARETDVVARFGGDEFALILPDTGSAGAMAVGARVRDRIAAHAFLAVEGVSYRLTVSIGAATLPDVARTAEELLEAADRAMYRVKDTGKNGIQAAGGGSR